MSHSALLWVSACDFSLFTNPRFLRCHVYVLSDLDFTNRCAFFPGEIDKPAQGILQRGKLKAVSVGICLEGVYVMDVKEKVSARLSWFIRVQSADTLAQYLFLSSLIFFFSFLQHVLLGLRFHELSWDHSYPEEEGDSHILWLEFDGEEDGTPVNKLLKIYSKQVRQCHGLARIQWI